MEIYQQLSHINYQMLILVHERTQHLLNRPDSADGKYKLIVFNSTNVTYIGDCVGRSICVQQQVDNLRVTLLGRLEYNKQFNINISGRQTSLQILIWRCLLT